MKGIDEIHAAMLAEIPDTYKKAPGYPAWDFTRAFAVAVQSLAADVEAVASRQDVANLTGADLDRYIEQHRGLERKYGAFASAVLTVVTGDGNIYAGDLFSTANGIQFVATDDQAVSVGDTFEVLAVQAGATGNVPENTIVYMPITLDGVSAVTNEAAAHGGADAETDIEYLDRFLYDLQNPANGANQASYISWATDIPGVGRAKVFPQAYGQNTLELCITSSAMGAPAQSVVELVQDAIDPNENGDGAGLAPLGARCVVTGCTEKAINVSMTLTVEGGYQKSAVLAVIEENLGEYLRSVAFVSSYVSYAQLSNVIHDTPGVYDFETLKINNGTTNVSLGDREVPVLGTVVG